MKREGRQHGMVRSSTIPPADFNPRPNAKVVNSLNSPPTAGFFTKVTTKPTNHSKYTTKCRRGGCRDCHSSPVSKSRDKAKGAHKLRSCDVVLNHRLVSWRVVADDRSLLNYKAISASEILDHLCDNSLYERDDCDDQDMQEDVHCGYGEHLYANCLYEREDCDERNMEEDVDYGHGEPLLGTIVGEGCSGGTKDEEMGGSSFDSGEDRDVGFYVVGIPWECSDEEDWLVVGRCET